MVIRLSPFTKRESIPKLSIDPFFVEPHKVFPLKNEIGSTFQSGKGHSLKLTYIVKIISLKNF